MIVKTELQKNFPWRIFTRVVLLQSFLVLVALGASGIAARYFFKKQFLDQLEGKLIATLTLLERQMPTEVTQTWCKEAGRGMAVRLTVLSLDGTVLCDSNSAPQNMENHLYRPEVQLALKKNYGADTRLSRTLGMEQVYVAHLMPERKLITRASSALTAFYSAVAVFDTSLGVVLAFFAIGLGLFAVWSGRKLVFPIGRLLLKTEQLLSRAPQGLLREEVETDSFGEWSKIESNIDDIRRDLEAKSKSLDAERVELSTIMSAISDAILAVSPDGTPLFYNSKFELLFGGVSLRQRQWKLWEVFREPTILNAFDRAFKDIRSTHTQALPLETTDGRKLFFSISVSALQRNDGEVYGAVGIFHDVSELKAAEQMRIDFVANVSHELRTPLTSIKGYAETLIQDASSDKGVEKDFLNIISRNANRLLNLMEDLLDLSAIESDQLLQLEMINTEEITQRVLKSLETRFLAKQQVVMTEFEEKRVTADVARVEQVLVNLLDNACKYTPEKGRITVSWVLKSNEIRLLVSDTGPGISKEHQARLFERFYRVDKARSREQGGTGLGLAIVKHIMQRHQGRVWVESVPGQGATFVAAFPEKGLLGKG